MGNTEKKCGEEIPYVEEQCAFMRSLNPDDYEALQFYIDHGPSFNRRIVNGRMSPRDKIIAKQIDSLFERAPATAEGFWVYRGIEAKNYHPQRHGYISTDSGRARTWNTFVGLRCCLLEIYIPAGSKILPLEEIGNSALKEREYLLPRTGTLLVDGEYTERSTRILRLVYKKSQNSRTRSRRS